MSRANGSQNPHLVAQNATRKGQPFIWSKGGVGENSCALSTGVATGRAGELQHAQPMEVRPDGQPKAAVPTQAKSAVPTEAESTVPTQPEKKPAGSTSADEVRERLNDMIRKELPALTKVYKEGIKKEAEEQARKKQPQKETMPNGPEKKSV